MSLGCRSRFVITRSTICRSVATSYGSSPLSPRRSLSLRRKAMERLSVLSRSTSKPRFIFFSLLQGVRIAWTMATTTGPHTVSTMLPMAYGTV